VESIGARKQLKESRLRATPCLKFGNFGAVVQGLRTHKSAFLRFSLEMRLSAAPRATHRGTGQGWKIGKLTPRLGPRNQSQSQPCIARGGSNIRNAASWADESRGRLKMPETAESVPEKEPELPRGWRYWSPRIAAIVLMPVLLIGATDGVLRLLDIGFPTDATVPCTLKGRGASCYNLFFPALFFPPGMIKTPQAYAIPAEKPARTYRIFVLGESAAMGDPDPAYAFSRYLEVMLRKRYPSTNFEVVNTGSVAVNSHVLLPLTRGLAKQRPDLFIIYSGNNEVVGPYGPGTALTSSGMSLPVIRTSIFFRSTRVGQLLTKLGAQKKE